MAIDPTSETLISLTDAARSCPARRGGKRPHVSCIYRWTTSGCKGVVLESLQVWQDGADGATVLFPADKLDEVADLLKLRRRRRMSERERQRLAGLGRAYRFQLRRHGFQNDSGALGATIGPKVDPGSLPTPKAAVRPSEMNRVTQ